LVASRTQELSRANEQLTEEIEEHRQAKEALRQQREWLRVTLTSIGDAVLATDTAGQITFLNPAAEALTGWMENQALGQPAQNIFRIINEQTRAPGQDIIAQVLREGQTVALANHTALIARDGREIPIEDSAAPIKDASGTVSGVVFVFHDVTQHKQKEGELQKLNRTLKALHQSSQAKAHATSESEYLDGVCKDVIANCGYAMVWIGFAEADEARSVLPVACAGFAEDYLKTLKITRACVCRNMQTDPALAPWRAEAVKRGYASSLALPLLFAGGAIGAITIYSRQVDPFSADEIQLMSQLADDVTLCLARLRAVADRQHAEDQLRLLSAAVESAANGIVITDRTAQILWVNRAFTQLTGYSRDEAVGQNPRILKSDEHSREFYLQMWDTLLNGKPWHGELVNRYKDGSLHQEEMTITPVLRDGAKITHFVAIKQDITERQRVRAALEQKSEELNRSNRDLEQFAYIASHDLQEPLRAVGGYVKLLQRRFPKNIDAKAVEYIKGAAEGAERMERLISDLLNFSRVGTRGGKFSPASFDDILKEASYNLQARIHSSQAAITHEALPTLTVDATQMMQLFQNLIGNAIKFRSDRPVEIHICARQEPERWVFSVRDNGIGIESQYFERIFQIFQRLHTRKHYPGTGIGLAICKKIVERHGGAIWVGSQPGIETTFFFSLPKTALKNQIEV
jgi:PAS domain S-box-containing protein